jgi:hypothetical protein
MINNNMKTNETILPTVTHSIDEEIESIVGEQFRASGYYNSANSINTVQYTLTSFSGTVQIQAALTVAPSDADWFTVYTDSATDTTGSHIETIVGNFTWMRAVVSNWSAGTVDHIRLNF